MVAHPAPALATQHDAGYRTYVTIIDWNGADLPDELRQLRPGRYVVETLDDAPALSPDDEQGLIDALESLRAGRGVSHEQVRARVARRFGT